MEIISEYPIIFWGLILGLVITRITIPLSTGNPFLLKGDFTDQESKAYDGKRNHNNNKMERLNGEFRDREKVVRGLKKSTSPLLSGYQIYHNYVRPHMALDEKTPAEAYGIKIEGGNKWLTLIQNAKRQK